MSERTAKTAGNGALRGFMDELPTDRPKEETRDPVLTTRNSSEFFAPRDRR
jgi:hypothetical protein